MSALLLGVTMAIIVLLIPAFDNLIVTLSVKVLAGVAIYVGGAVLFKVETFKYLWKLALEMLGK